MFKGVVFPQKASDAAAIQALGRGTASEGQQKMALNCIVTELSGSYEMTYDPDGKHSGFNEGKRSVGRSIVGILTTSLNSIADAEKRLIAKRTPKKRG
jgi:hypothetical protein